MNSVRKELYLAPERERKLSRLAQEWRCSEAEVVLRALDRLPDLDALAVGVVRESGLLAPAIDSGLGQADDDIEILESEYGLWLAGHHDPLSLAETVIAERKI